MIEATRFLPLRSPNKRDEVIEALLASPELVDYWGFRFGDLFRATFVTSNNTAALKAYEEWIVTSLIANKPFDKMAIEHMAAQGRSAPARNFYYVSEKVAPEVLMPELIRVSWSTARSATIIRSKPRAIVSFGA